MNDDITTSGRPWCEGLAKHPAGRQSSGQPETFSHHCPVLLGLSEFGRWRFSCLPTPSSPDFKETLMDTILLGSLRRCTTAILVAAALLVAASEASATTVLLENFDNVA